MNPPLFRSIYSFSPPSVFSSSSPRSFSFLPWNISCPWIVQHLQLLNSSTSALLFSSSSLFFSSQTSLPPTFSLPTSSFHPPSSLIFVSCPPLILTSLLLPLTPEIFPFSHPWEPLDLLSTCLFFISSSSYHESLHLVTSSLSADFALYGALLFDEVL